MQLLTTTQLRLPALILHETLLVDSQRRANSKQLVSKPAKFLQTSKTFYVLTMQKGPDDWKTAVRNDESAEKKQIRIERGLLYSTAFQHTDTLFCPDIFLSWDFVFARQNYATPCLCGTPDNCVLHKMFPCWKFIPCDSRFFVERWRVLLNAVFEDIISDCVFSFTFHIVNVLSLRFLKLLYGCKNKSRQIFWSVVVSQMKPVQPFLMVAGQYEWPGVEGLRWPLDFSSLVFCLGISGVRQLERG